MATTRSTASKPAARKPAAHFSVAQAEKEHLKGLDEIEPFTVEMRSGALVTLSDPREIGWQAAAALDMGNPFGMLRELVSDEEWEDFVKEDFNLQVMRSMVLAWREHYGIDGDFAGN